MNEWHWLPLPSPMLGAGSDPRRQKALAEFLAGPENRLAETAVRMAIGGVPFFADSEVTHNLSEKIRKENESGGFSLAGLKAGKRNERRSGRIGFDWHLPPPLRPDGTSPAVIDYMPMANVPLLSPIVFYGPSGCGKTQLAGGICREFRKSNPQAEGIFLNASEFYRTFTSAIDENRTTELRALFARCRIIVFDNLEELEDHPVGIAELLSILKTAEESQTIVILTLSRHPDSVVSLPISLRARLVGGLLVPVVFPSEESRRLLLRRYAEAFRVKLPPEAEKFILEKFPKPPGEFYGLFAQLCQLQQWEKNRPDIGLIGEFLDQRRTQKPLSLDLIAKTAARIYAVRLSELRSKTRRKTVVTARNMILYIARRSMTITLQELGNYFSGRDHSTILHGIRSIEQKIDSDNELRHQYEMVMGTLNKIAKIDG